MNAGNLGRRGGILVLMHRESVERSRCILKAPGEPKVSVSRVHESLERVNDFNKSPNAFKIYKRYSSALTPLADQMSFLFVPGKRNFHFSIATLSTACNASGKVHY